jgi:hypothetical protein
VLPILIQIKQILGFENQQKLILRLPDIRSTIIDYVFPPEKRRTNPSPLIKRSELYTPIQAIALTRRGGAPQRIDNQTMTNEAWEPFPINPYRGVTGADLNNWRLWNGETQEQYIARQIDLNRHTIRLTTEAMGAQALGGGALDYPILIDGAMTSHYKITFGSIATVSVSKKWDAADAKAGHVVKVLVDMRDQIQTSGYGSQVKYLAGKSAIFALFNLISSATNDARYPTTVTENEIVIAGNTIRLCSETYYNPQTKSLVKKVADTALIGFAADAPHELVYSALDDIQSGFIASPFWSKPVYVEGDNEIRIVSESKPLPVVYTPAVAKATVSD